MVVNNHTISNARNANDDKVDANRSSRSSCITIVRFKLHRANKSIEGDLKRGKTGISEFVCRIERRERSDLFLERQRFFFFFFFFRSLLFDEP